MTHGIGVSVTFDADIFVVTARAVATRVGTLKDREFFSAAFPVIVEMNRTGSATKVSLVANGSPS